LILRPLCDWKYFTATYSCTGYDPAVSFAPNRISLAAVYWNERQVMKKLTLTLATLLGIIVIASLTVSAQAPRNSRDQVCVYENNHFGGWQQCFLPGEQVGDLGAHRNQISSIRVYGEARAQAFADRNFEGTALDVNADLNDLAQQRVSGGFITGTWNDKIESIRVTSRLATNTTTDRRNDAIVTQNSRIDNREIYRDDRDRDDRDYRNDRRYGRNNTICVFEDTNYRGRYECFDSGDEIADLGRYTSWNDRVSSIKVFGPARVTLYRDINFRGDRITVDRDIPDLRRLRMTASMNWDNQVSSLDINGGRGRAYGRDIRR
jgi:Peptidase inhibitor family I36